MLQLHPQLVVISQGYREECNIRIDRNHSCCVYHPGTASKNTIMNSPTRGRALRRRELYHPSSEAQTLEININIKRDKMSWQLVPDHVSRRLDRNASLFRKETHIVEPIRSYGVEECNNSFFGLNLVHFDIITEQLGLIQ